MNNSRNQEEHGADVEKVLSEFDGKRYALISFAEKTRTLVQEILDDAKIRYQSVQGRVKDRLKLKEKFLDQRKNYKCLEDITDQVALRVVTYYEDEVDAVAEIIRKEFDIDLERSVDKRETEPDKFGYYALNFVCKYDKDRAAQPEYKKHAGILCEIQIVSILRHAWSEIEHPWYDLKVSYPDNIKRRFARMAALLEIAESEFHSLRQIQSDYRKSVAVQVEANVPDLQVDAVSMRSFIAQEPLVTEIDKSIALVLRVSYTDDLSDSWVERRSMSAKLAGMTKLQDLRASLKKYRTAIPEYVGRCKQEVWSESPAGDMVNIGVSVYHLSQFLVNLAGAEATNSFLKAHGFTDLWDISRQMAIAKQIAEKYSS